MIFFSSSENIALNVFAFCFATDRFKLYFFAAVGYFDFDISTYLSALISIFSFALKIKFPGFKMCLFSNCPQMSRFRVWCQKNARAWIEWETKEMHSIFETNKLDLKFYHWKFQTERWSSNLCNDLELAGFKMAKSSTTTTFIWFHKTLVFIHSFILKDWRLWNLFLIIR